MLKKKRRTMHFSPTSYATVVLTRSRKRNGFSFSGWADGWATEDKLLGLAEKMGRGFLRPVNSLEPEDQ